VARILIVGGGCRGRTLASELIADRHAVRITTRTEAGRGAIEALGAECWIGTPDRLATMHAVLDSVTLVCWLLGTASGGEDELAALHGTRLDFFLTRAIDTTVRGVIYEAGGSPAGLLRDGALRARALAEHNAIPVAVLDADPADADGWSAQARAAISSLVAAHG
jgi:hypothetical protein